MNEEDDFDSANDSDYEPVEEGHENDQNDVICYFLLCDIEGSHFFPRKNQKKVLRIYHQKEKEKQQNYGIRWSKKIKMN